MNRQDHKLEVLASVPLFARCTRAQLLDLARITDEVTVPEGRVLCRQGGTGAECFVVVSGKARVDVDGTEVQEVGPGEIVGEVSLIDYGPRTATVTATTGMDLLVVEVRAFQQLLDDVPGLSRVIMTDLAHRLRALGAAH
ncbi:MAG: cyclic nucleotide-binding domain-containing protein [Actinomycetota bacterium]|nr:cyclic nucleotide-binding domain-containing protein [Actinomycetota bacterium]